MKALVPHGLFLIVAGYVFRLAWLEECCGIKGRWITVPGLVLSIYYSALACYLVSYFFSVWLIKRRTGQWRLGIAYLLAVAVFPVVVPLFLGAELVVVKVFF